jgi:hypothetical protein
VRRAEAPARRAADPWFAAVLDACQRADPIGIAYVGEFEYAYEADDLAWLLPRQASSADDCARLARETFVAFFAEGIGQEPAAYVELGEELWDALQRLAPPPPPGKRPFDSDSAGAT